MILSEIVWSLFDTVLAVSAATASYMLPMSLLVLGWLQVSLLFAICSIRYSLHMRSAVYLNSRIMVTLGVSHSGNLGSYTSLVIDVSLVAFKDFIQHWFDS